MVVHRTKFFLGFFLLLIIPLLLNKIVWLIQSQKTKGIYAFHGAGNALDQIRITFSEIYFKHGSDTIWVKGPENLFLKPGTVVPVRYQPQNPSDAKIDSFFGIWFATIIYGGVPSLILLVIFFTPGIVPWKSKLRLTIKKPFIQIVG
jgi:uncharacterized protein DUF3592